MKKYLWLFILPLLLFIPKETHAQSIYADGSWGSYMDQVGQPITAGDSVINIGNVQYMGTNTINSSSPYVTMPKRDIYSTSTAGIVHNYYRFYYLSQINVFANATFNSGSYYTINYEFNTGSYVNVNLNNLRGITNLKGLYNGDYTQDMENVSINVSYDDTTAVGKISITFKATINTNSIRTIFGNYNDRYNSNLFLNSSDTYSQGFRVYLISAEETQDLSSALLAQITGQNQTIINQNQTIIENSNKTNQNLEDIESSITSEDAPDLDALEDSAGWLPPGPVDSILNLPLTFFNNLISNLSKTCQPIEVPLPYVATTLTLPCISSLYAQIGVTDFLNWVGIVVGTILLYNYFLNLYAWIDKTIKMEDQGVDDWGGV